MTLSSGIGVGLCSSSPRSNSTGPSVLIFGIFSYQDFMFAWRYWGKAGASRTRSATTRPCKPRSERMKPRSHPTSPTVFGSRSRRNNISSEHSVAFGLCLGEDRAAIENFLPKKISSCLRWSSLASTMTPRLSHYNVTSNEF